MKLIYFDYKLHLILSRKQSLILFRKPCYNYHLEL